MRVLIANPPAYIKDHSRHLVQAGSRWSFSIKIPKGSCKDHYLPYPFFLGYSSALLKRDTDVNVRAVDACALDFDENDFIYYVKSHEPDVLVMEVPTISFPLVMDLVKEIKEKIGCRIVIAGSHATALAEDIMKKYPFIDYCLLGEYEITLKDLVKHVLTAKDDIKNAKDVDGLAFRRGNKVVVNERRELLKDLDSLPYPDRDDLPVEYYHDFEIVGKPCVQMLTSRGCPSACIFCIERQVTYASPLYRRRDPVKVVDEISFVKERYRAKQIYFDDETATINRRHIGSICKEMMVRKLDISWTCMGDITLGYDTLKHMARANCVGLKFGVETINMRTIADIKKSFINLDKVKQFTKWCKELDLWTHATYMIGLPGDTKEDILKTLDFAVKLGTDSAQFSIATPFPGTPFFEIAEENGWLITYDWTMYDGASYSVVSYPWLTKDEIEQLYKMALKQYYKHAIIRTLLSPGKIFRLTRAKSLQYALNKALWSLRGY